MRFGQHRFDAGQSHGFRGDAGGAEQFDGVLIGRQIISECETVPATVDRQPRHIHRADAGDRLGRQPIAGRIHAGGDFACSGGASAAAALINLQFTHEAAAIRDWRPEHQTIDGFATQFVGRQQAAQRRPTTLTRVTFSESFIQRTASCTFACQWAQMIQVVIAASRIAGAEPIDRSTGKRAAARASAK